VVTLVFLLLAAAARAQDNSSTTDPPTPAQGEPPLVQKVRVYVEQNPMLQQLEGDGFYPRLGGLSPGSGLAGGVGYRRHLRWVYLDGSALVSAKAYRGIDAEARWIDSKGIRVSTVATFRNDTQDDFYGLGMDSTDATRVDFGIRWTDLDARASARLLPWLRVGVDAGYLMPTVRHGRDDRLRTIEEIFTDATAPGLAQQPNFAHEGVFAEIDSRDAEGFPTRGGFFRAAYSVWDDRTFNTFDFRRFDVETSHFLSVTAKDVIAARLRLMYANNAPGERIPFYMLPYLGGGDTVRAFREFRFRDENAGVFNVELRHRIHPLVHVAGFVDVGKVAHDWQGINPTDVKRAYGFGIRAGTADRTLLRFDVAYGGDDGTRYFLKFTPSF
jgi:opacity protein-like surface antigen